jgi:flagellar hook assembly protein FlgD
LSLAGPNPFAGECRVLLAGAQGGSARVRVFDVRGRLVADLYGGQPGPREEIVWDGRDGNGRKVSSGIYFINAETSSASVSNKVIFVR